MFSLFFLFAYLSVNNQRTLDTRDNIIATLIQKVEVFVQRIDQLEAKVSIYKQRLARYENPKNSSNSSIPPSKDENRPARNQSLRGTSQNASSVAW